jgi:hypothetical protein
VDDSAKSNLNEIKREKDKSHSLRSRESAAGNEMSAKFGTDMSGNTRTL